MAHSIYAYSINMPQWCHCTGIIPMAVSQDIGQWSYNVDTGIINTGMSQYNYNKYSNDKLI